MTEGWLFPYRHYFSSVVIRAAEVTQRLRGGVLVLDSDPGCGTNPVE